MDESWSADIGTGTRQTSDDQRRDPHSDSFPTFGIRIDTLAALADPSTSFGARLAQVPPLAAAFRAEFVSTGKPDRVSTHDLITLPYPTRLALWRAATTLAPFVSITNRMLIIRWTDPDGRGRVLLFEPSDVERGVATPYFTQLAARTPRPLRNLLVTCHADVLEHLAAVGIGPEEVDYLVFDHLHPGRAPLARHHRAPISTSTPASRCPLRSRTPD